MGTESKRSSQSNNVRGKPPPVPPRPDHLLPVKNGATQYSSMPDILAGRKKDSNPDLLTKLRQQKDDDRDYCCYRRRDHSLDRKISLLAFPSDSKRSSNVAGAQTSSARCRGDAKSSSTAKSSGGGLMKSFSCIPSRSNSKKKKGCGPFFAGPQASGTATVVVGRPPPAPLLKPQVRQTNWYIDEDAAGGGNFSIGSGGESCNLIACPSWQAALNDNYSSTAIDNDFSDSRRPIASITRVSSDHKIPSTYRMANLSSNCSLSAGLPPLPKSLSDASLSWDYVTKKLAANDQSCSSKANPGPPPSTSSRSSSVSSSSHPPTVHPKVPPPPPPTIRAESPLPISQLAPSAATPSSADSDGKLNGENVAASDLSASLDSKLATLRKEMCELRQMDLSLLNQLWSLNQAIHEFRQLQQEALSLRTPSSDEDDDDEEIERLYSNVANVKLTKRTSLSHQNSVSGSSSSHSTIRSAPPVQNLYTDL